MGLFQATTELDYPESDGRPMGETDLHRKWMIRVTELLEQRYRDQRVYVTSDLLLYYVDGLPMMYVVPDVFVVKDTSTDNRRTYKVWEEGQPPHVVFEVTSRATRRQDEVEKPGIYSKIGVRELFLYDPTADYLRPPLQGFNLQATGEPVRIEPDSAGRITSAELGIDLRLDGYNLVMSDVDTGDVLLTEAEAAHAANEAAQAAREAAQQENEKLRQEIEQLLEQLRQHKPNGD